MCLFLSACFIFIWQTLNCGLLTDCPRKFQWLQNEEKGTCKDSAGKPFSSTWNRIVLLKITTNAKCYRFYYQIWLFSVNRISWLSVTRSRLVYQTTYQRSSQKILPWLSKATASTSCAIHCSVSKSKVYEKLQVWSRTYFYLLLVWCVWKNRRRLVNNTDALYVWYTFSGLKSYTNNQTLCRRIRDPWNCGTLRKSCLMSVKFNFSQAVISFFSCCDQLLSVSCGDSCTHTTKSMWTPHYTNVIFFLNPK